LYCVLLPYVFLSPDCPGFCLCLYCTTQHKHKHKHPCLRRDSNPQPQQAIGRGPSPQTARPLGSAGLDPRTVQLVASRYTDWAIPVHALRTWIPSFNWLIRVNSDLEKVLLVVHLGPSAAGTGGSVFRRPHQSPNREFRLKVTWCGEPLSSAIWRCPRINLTHPKRKPRVYKVEACVTAAPPSNRFVSNWHFLATMTKGFPRFFLSCKANTRV
jgi:hypothetical protein